MSAPPQRPQNRPKRTGNDELDTQTEPSDSVTAVEAPNSPQPEKQCGPGPAESKDDLAEDNTVVKNSTADLNEPEPVTDEPSLDKEPQEASPAGIKEASNTEDEIASEAKSDEPVSSSDAIKDSTNNKSSADAISPTNTTIEENVKEAVSDPVSPRSKPVDFSDPVTPVEVTANTKPPRPTTRPKSSKAAAFEAALTSGASSKPAPKRPLGSKIGSLQNTLFADLNSALARGPASPTATVPVVAAPVAPQQPEKKQEPANLTQPEPQPALAIPSAARARGPRRRLPAAATPQLTTVSISPLWRTERIPRATAPSSPALSARGSIAGLNSDNLLTRNNSAVDVAKFVMSSAEPQRQLSRTDLPALSKLVDPAVTGNLQHADAHAAGAHAHSLGSSGSSAPSQGFLAAMATMPEMFAPPRIQRELQEASRRQKSRTANSQGANVKFSTSEESIEPDSGPVSRSGSPEPVVTPPSEPAASLKNPVAAQFDESDSKEVLTESDGQASAEDTATAENVKVQEMAASDTQAAPVIEITATVPTNALADALSRVEMDRPARPASRPQRRANT